MNRSGVVWTFCLPLIFAGTEAAHWLAFRIVYPDSWQRAQALQGTGHSYFAWLPLIAGIGIASAVTSLVSHARHASRRGDQPPSLSPAAFAALPPLAFALQEQAELVAHSGTLFGALAEPTFLLGLLLQLPFAMVAFVVATLLLRAAAQIGIAAGHALKRTRPGRAPAKRARPTPELRLPPLPVLASGCAERGPPV